MANAQSVINSAASHIGITGTDNIFNTWIWGRHVYDDHTYPWCAAFVSYVLFKENGMAGAPSASASGVATQFTRINDNDVQPGDLVVFNWDGRNDTGWCDHVGIVEWSNIPTSGYFGTIEGNTTATPGGAVARVTRDNNSSYFTAFYRPNYGSGGSETVAEPGGGNARNGNTAGSGGSDASGKGSSTPAQWQGEMKGKEDTTGSNDDYAGVVGRPILLLAIDGVGDYQASDIHNDWWDKVNQYNPEDLENGVAGDKQPIDRVRIFDPTVKYQTHNLGGVWNGVMQGTKDISGESDDDFAGETGVQQDLIRIWRDNGDQPVYQVFS